jgi:hypothetical protein
MGVRKAPPRKDTGQTHVGLLLQRGLRRLPQVAKAYNSNAQRFHRSLQIREGEKEKKKKGGEKPKPSPPEVEGYF